MRNLVNRTPTNAHFEFDASNTFQKSWDKSMFTLCCITFPFNNSLNISEPVDGVFHNVHRGEEAEQKILAAGSNAHPPQSEPLAWSKGFSETILCEAF